MIVERILILLKDKIICIINLDIKLLNLFLESTYE